MSGIIIRDMLPEDEYFVSTCSHVDESEETDDCGRRRLSLLRELVSRGGSVKAALVDGHHVGFAYGIPIEISPWGPMGEGLMVIPCLYVMQRGSKAGVGRALIEAIEDDAKSSGRVGITTIAFRGLPGAEWFMPASFFEHLGYDPISEQGRTVLLWKTFSEEAEPPRLLKPTYEYRPVHGKVVIDLFWNGFCQTSSIEAQRVREVCSEFGDRVLLNEFCADDHNVLLTCEIERAIYVAGREIGWGYEAPRDGIRAAIEQALQTG